MIEPPEGFGYLHPMNKMFRSSLVVALASALMLTGCKGSDSPFDPVEGSKNERRPEKERKELTPNPLFVAVDNNQLKMAEAALADNPGLIRSINAQFGETPFGMALRLEEPELAGYLLEKMDLNDLYFQNARGESYVFLAARAGYPALIRGMADRLFSSLGALSRFDFTELDLPDQDGRLALSVARDRNTAMALGDQFYRGILMAPWWSFFHHEDDKERTFLHWAAADNRQDVIAWAAESLCHNEAEPDEGWLAWGWRNIVDAQMTLQFQTGDWGWTGDLIVNRTDDQNRTAMHYAADNLAINALKSLQNCALVDPYVKDKDGNTFLHIYLSRLDQRSPQLREDLIAAIAPMAAAEAWVQSTYSRRYGMLEVANNAGETPAHLAALLSDGRPFEILQSLNPMTATDSRGLTPEVLRRQTLKSQNEATTR